MVLFYVNQTKINFSLKNYFDGEISYYTDSKQNSDCINLGFCYISNEVNKNSTIIGESIKIKNLEVASAINTLKAQIIKTEYLENGTNVIYAYSPLIKSSIQSSNNKINLQIATNDEYSTIGWPLILGSL